MMNVNRFCECKSGYVFINHILLDCLQMNLLTVGMFSWFSVLSSDVTFSYTQDFRLRSWGTVVTARMNEAFQKASHTIINELHIQMCFV